MSASRAMFERMADRAFATGKAVREGGMIAVPDLAVVSGVANGLEAPPPTWSLRRADGRAVYFYRDPAARKRT